MTAATGDPFLKASLSNYLESHDEAALIPGQALFEASTGFGGMADLDLFGGGSLMPEPPKSEDLLYAPLSPPDSSQGWSGDSSHGSDDDQAANNGTHSMVVDPPAAQAAAYPLTATALSQTAATGYHQRHRAPKVEDLEGPVPSLLRFPTFDAGGPSAAPATPALPAKQAKAAAAVLQSHTPSPVDFTKHPSGAVAGLKAIAPLRSAHTAGRASGSGTGKKKAPSDSARKRTLHNAIERRYRNSINDKINELKTCLPSHLITDEKMNKSSIIQKGIDYIRLLEEENRQLRTTGFGDPGMAGAHTPPAELPPSPTDSNETSRMLLCALVCGLFVFSPGSSLTAAAAAAPAAHTHGTARVLASVSEDDRDTSSMVSAMLPFALFWAVRAAAGAAALFLVFRQDSVTDPREASENSARCAEALRERNVPKAKHYAAKSLALLGAPLPTTHWGLFFGLVGTFLRQMLHRFYVGQWIDTYLVERNDTVLSTGVAASMNHELHQMMLRLGEPTEWTHLSRLYLTMRALNASESIPSKVDPATMIQVYVSAAIQMELIFQTDLASTMSDYYLRQARRIYYKHPEVAPNLSWLFKPNGNTFFRSGSWISKTVIAADGEVIHPGCFEQLTSTFHLDLLGQGLLEISAGHNTDRVHDLFADLRESATVCQDPSKKWWGIMGLAHISWRRGRKAVAREYLVELETLEFGQLTPAQNLLYAASRAHQALLDGDHKLCWQACQVGSDLCEEGTQAAADGSEEAEYYQSLRKLALLLGFRQLLSTRVGLVRLRLYLGQDDASNVPAIEGSAGSAGAVTRASMLVAIQQDIGRLRRLSDGLPMARSTVFKYQAIHRSLAGGRVALTERMFHKGIKVAKEQSLPFEEASLLLHAAVYLRSTMSTQTLRLYLSRAATIFERLQAAEELCTSRKLLQVALYA